MKFGSPTTRWTSSWAAVLFLFGHEASAAFSLDSDAAAPPLLAKDDASADRYSGMAWLTDQCPGRRTSSQKEGLEACVRWSTGLEHESFLVHSHERNKEEYVVNVGSAANQMSRYGRAFGLDRETHSVAVYLEQTGVEFSGRSCAGINEINFKSMAESVSTDHEQLSFDSAFCQVQLLDSKILEVVSSSPNEKDLVSSLGPIQPPRAGMSSQLGVYTRTGGKTHLCSACDSCDLKDYTGSYHVSISLPRDPEGWVVFDESSLSEDGSTCSETYARASDAGETPLSVWVGAHQNLANMVQWVEPLLLAVYGAADSEAVCDGGRLVEGSYRTMNSGWGIPGTTDVRTFGDVGTGRFAHSGFDWLLELVNDASAGLLGCEAEGMGADIRTKSSSASAGNLPTCQCRAGGEDPAAAPPALPPMEVGDGLEIRVFDNFPVENIKTVYRAVALLAEASRQHRAEDYVYGHPGWKVAAQAAMREGWNAVLGAEYVGALEKNLNVDLSAALRGNSQAFLVFSELCAQLSSMHEDGFWTSLFLDDVAVGSTIHNPNRASWEAGAMDLGYTPSKIREFLDYDNLVNSDNVLELLPDSYSGGSDCGEDVEDLVYLAQTYGMVDYLGFNADGSVKAVGFFAAADDEDVELRSCTAAAGPAA